MVDSLTNRAGFIQCFLILILWIRIPDNTSADLVVELAIFKVQAANRDVELGIAIESNVSDGAALSATTRGLELFDDLHRADLRSTSDRTPWEDHSQGIVNIFVLGKRGFDACCLVDDLSIVL